MRKINGPFAENMRSPRIKYESSLTEKLSQLDDRADALQQGARFVDIKWGASSQ